MSRKTATAPVVELPTGEKSGAAKLAELDYEEQAARLKAGKAEKTYGVWGPIWRFTQWLDSLKG